MKSCSQEIHPPEAMKKPYKMVNHGHERQDDYYWMRLTDNQKTTTPYDEPTKEVIDYINAENEYTREKLSDTKDLQNRLFDEMVSRIKKDDRTVPYLMNGYYYYSRYEKGKEYAIYCRKKVP